MMSFDDYFDDEAIIDQLCRVRVRHAEARNDALFLHRISSSRRKLPEAHSLDIFPPRRIWHRYRRRHRHNQSSVQLKLAALKTATKDLRSKEPKTGWAIRLNERILEIRSRATDYNTFSFKKPFVLGKEKDRGSNEFRPIASFSDDDKIIDCLAAKYFREMLDSVMDDSSLAFRCSRNGNPPPVFHDALDKILSVRRRNQKNGLYVAECDIRKFFDCVDHSVALHSLHMLVTAARDKNPQLEVDPRALRIFRGYLDCYCFPINVKGEAEPQIQLKKPGASFPWPEKELREFHSDPAKSRIGVPQGGALSCVIANCVLTIADKEIRRLRRSLSAFTYLRYCDDMIILSASRDTCNMVFRKYQELCRALLLPIHAPNPVAKYTRDFWNGKSNEPYHWARVSVPWIQFVGYQVRYDGLVRIRRKSLKKQTEKLTTITNELLKELKPNNGNSAVLANIRCKPAQILHRFRQKLLSLSVGRRQVNRNTNEPLPMCWSSGFRGLNGKRFAPSMLKVLDRHRERQVRRLCRRLDSLTVSRGQPPKLRMRLPGFYGYPFSYLGQFLKKK